MGFRSFASLLPRDHPPKPGLGAIVVTTVLLASGLCTVRDAEGAHASCSSSRDCDDNDRCTLDLCLSFCFHRRVECDDHDPCTVDSCDPVVGCVYGGDPCGATTSTFGPPPEGCADADGDGAVMASDALATLRAAVGGASSCEPCVCDVTGEGLLTTTDAMSILRFAVGMPTKMECQPC